MIGPRLKARNPKDPIVQTEPELGRISPPALEKPEIKRLSEEG